MAELTKSQVLKELEDSRAEWEALLAQVGEDRINIPGVTGEWAVKDVLGHLTAWAARPVAWIEAIRHQTEPAPAPWSRDWTEEQTNDFIYQQAKARSAAELVADWRSTYERVIAGVRALPEAVVVTEKIEFLGGNTLAKALAGNSWEHAREHAGCVRTWLDKQPAG